MLESFYRRATLAGIKNLETNSYRKDSPVLKNRDRFPEKYSSLHGSRLEPNQESFALNILNKLDSNIGVQNDVSISNQAKMTKSEEQLILEAAFSAVCDNIMTN
jgi:hypothetical protein